MNKYTLLDSTLRDGAQGEGISFSVEDKLAIVKALDAVGITYIEAGNPGSNPKDLEFFRRAGELKLKNSEIVAFGSTRRKDISVHDDQNLKALLSAGTDTVAVFGKCSLLHIREVLGTTPDENRAMICDTVSFLKGSGKTVIFDAEHFFDGYKEDARTAMDALSAAKDGGADIICLCDTNGGSFPDELHTITGAVAKALEMPVGIHCHNDTGMAVANSIMAVKAGAVHIQGTFLGFGERTGNASLSIIIPNIQLKLGIRLISDDGMRLLTPTALSVAETANINMRGNEPYIGRSAFAHKAGMHADGVLKAPQSFEHINPQDVGNERRFLISEITGRTALLEKLRGTFPELKKNSPELGLILCKIKEKEHEGYQYEGAEGSFTLIVLEQLGRYKPFFELVHYKIIGEHPHAPGLSATALIKVSVSGQTQIAVVEGNGPVNALDMALRRALEVFYPVLGSVRLIDYKVRVMDSRDATGAAVRVLITSTDGKRTWTTVGVSSDIIEASFIALTDSIEYILTM